MILGIEGSPRKQGNSHRLLDAVLAGASEMENDCSFAHLREYAFEACVGCEACRKARACVRFYDGMTLLYPRIEKARGLILISPVHNYNITAWMKAFIDRLYCYYDFADTRPREWSSRLAGGGRKAVIGAVAEQAGKEDMGFALDAMRLPLEAHGYEIVSEIAVLGVFDRGHVVKNRAVMEQADLAGRTLATAIADR